MSEDRTQDLAAELKELKVKREQALRNIAQVEEQLGRAIAFRTKIDGAIEWVESVYKKEEAEKAKKAKESLEAAEAERLATPQ